LLQSEVLPFFNPILEEVGRQTRIHDLSDVGAGIAQADDDPGMMEHGLYGIKARIEERIVKYRLPVAFDGQRDERLSRADV
jgi:hypothetical protein